MLRFEINFKKLTIWKDVILWSRWNRFEIMYKITKCKNKNTNKNHKTNTTRTATISEYEKKNSVQGSRCFLFFRFEIINNLCFVTKNNDTTVPLFVATIMAVNNVNNNIFNKNEKKWFDVLRKKKDG